MITPKTILKIGVLCLLPAAVLGADAVELFQRSQASEKRVSYRGMKVATLCSGNGSTKALFKVVHMKPDMTRTEYFAPAMLGGVVFIQNGQDSWRFSPTRSMWKKLRHPQAQLPCALSQEALANFDLRLVGPDKVAGRDVYEIRAIPKRPSEPSRRMWIDSDYYTVIASQVERPDGRILTRSEFTKIEFNPPDISPSIFKVSGKVEEPVKSTEPPFKVLKPSYVPAGYKLVGIETLIVQGVPSVHLQYSNGGSTISVFERKADSALVGPHSGGKVLNVYTCLRGGMQFTLIGSVSRAELRKIADSLR
jgi:outer membrane lipoprotein-sorting protein